MKKKKDDREQVKEIIIKICTHKPISLLTSLDRGVRASDITPCAILLEPKKFSSSLTDRRARYVYTIWINTAQWVRGAEPRVTKVTHLNIHGAAIEGKKKKNFLINFQLLAPRKKRKKKFCARAFHCYWPAPPPAALLYTILSLFFRVKRATLSAPGRWTSSIHCIYTAFLLLLLAFFFFIHESQSNV